MGKADVVWGFLQQAGIKSPQDPIELSVKLGYRVYTYIEGKALLDELHIPKEAMHRAAFTARHDNVPCIFYAPGLPLYQRNHAVLHELGHCVCGHENIDNIIFGDTSNAEIRMQQEEEAEEFALELLPTPVLYRADIKKYKDIQRVIKLDNEATARVARRVADYEAEYFDLPEKLICEQFKDFIRQSKRIANKRINRRQFIAAISLSVALVLATLGVTVSFLTLSRQPATATPTAITSEVSVLPQGQIVYWTDSGDVYHVDRNCQHIRNRSNVRSGTVAESGKGRVCKTCG